MPEITSKRLRAKHLAASLTAILVGSLLGPLVFSAGPASGNGGYYLYSNYTNGPSPILQTDDVLRDVFTRDGYTLAAWTATPDGRGERVAPNASRTTTGDFYAQWRDTVTADLYRNWETALPSGTRGPRAGQIVYASAFERELSRGVLRDAPRVETDSGALVYKTPEEYVYRITTVPNAPTASVDRQSNSGYTGLTSTQQADWYREMGFTDPNDYQFSWGAFMCVSENLDVSGNVVRTATRPTGLSVSYASREDGIRGASDANFESAYNVMFRELTDDLYSNALRSTRTVVGINDFSYSSNALVGGPDVVESPPSFGFHSLGVLDVVSNCGADKTLETIGIVGSDFSPITTKSFEIPRELILDLGAGGDYLTLNSAGLTIGVTGRREPFNAALWGLTTISGGGSSGGVTVDQTAPAKTKSVVYRGFPGNSSKVPAALRRGVVKFASSFQEVSSVACTGYTSGLVPTRSANILAKKRAKAACDLVKDRFPEAKVKLLQKPAKGVGAQFRSVRIRITGN